MNLARFPPVRFAHMPTPLEPMPETGRSHLGGPQLWIKRDDCTGLAGGGNKTRKLEYLLGDASPTTPTPWSPRARSSRTTCARPRPPRPRFGLACEIILEERTGSKAVDYTQSGNVLLDELLGAKIRRVPGGTDMNAELAEAAAEVARARRAALRDPRRRLEHHRRAGLCGMRAGDW